MKDKQAKYPQLRFKGFTDPWVQRKVSETAEVNPKTTLPDEFEYVDLGAVVGTSLNETRHEFKVSAPSRAQRLASVGDVFYQTVRPYQKNNYLFKNAGITPFVFSTGYAQLRPQGDSYFLLTLLQGENFVSQVMDRSTGTSYPAINSSDLGNMHVDVPTEAEQVKIGSLFKSLDNLIAANQRKLDLLKEQKKGYLQKMFPKNGAKVPELRFAGFADDWEERKLTDLATTYIGLVTTMTENYTTEGTLLIRNSDIKEGRFDLSNPIYLEEQFAEKNKTRRMKKGDVVTVHTGDIGTSAIINSELDGTIGFATITTRPKKELDSNFLAWYFNSNYHKKYAKRMSTGDGRSNYNMKDFNKNVIPTPKIAEQQKIGSFFKQLDEILALHQRKLDLLKEQKKDFLQKMFV